MNIDQQSCDNRYCPFFAVIGSGNIKVYSYTEQRFYCSHCQSTFSSDRGTFFETLRTDRQSLLEVISMLVERNSLRAITRIKHCKLDTVRHWLDLAGYHTAAVTEHLLRDFSSTGR